MAQRKLKAWPNGLGYDFGSWELLRPVTASHPWRARYIPRGERSATKYGEGSTYQEALSNAKPIE